MHLLAWFLLVTVGLVVTPRSGQAFLQFDGSPDNFVEIQDPSNGDFSISTPERTGLTISAWIRPDALCFLNTDGLGYVHWLGKGVGAGPTGQQEWTFRMYSEDNGEGRDTRISFYVFNLAGGEGIGSFFQDPVEVGEWIHVVGVADDQRTFVYKNGVLRKCDQYTGVGDPRCQQYTDPTRWITPQHGTAPLRIGHRDRNSYFQGGIARVRVWNRALSPSEVADLYFAGQVPPGLVAEYLLNQNPENKARDTVGAHDGEIMGTRWTWGTDPEPGP